MMKSKMNTKNVLVSFFAIASVLSLLATVSGFTVTGDLANVLKIEVDGINANNSPSVVAGDKIRVEIEFTSLIGDPKDSDNDGSDVRVKAEIEGEKVDVEDRTPFFDVESGKSYKKVLILQVPFDLKRDVSGNLNLNLKIWNKDFRTEVRDISLRVQRPSFNANILSVTASNSVQAGEILPVDVVLKNRGYNDLDDLFVTVSIPALEIEKTNFFGDLVAIEKNTDDEDDTDSVSGRIFLEIPFGVKTGIYTIEVKVKNDDTVNSAVGQIAVRNEFPRTVISDSLKRTANVGENVEYNLLLVNPTNNLKIYRIVTGSSSDVTSKASKSVLAVPAKSSEVVTITANAVSGGEHEFKVDVLSGEQLVDSVTLMLDSQDGQVTSPIVILTVILAIIFLVLLVVLIVLLGKKPGKAEEFGESYY